MKDTPKVKKFFHFFLFLSTIINMNHLNINIDTYEIDGEVIIGNIHIIINSTDRIAIVGPNGVGKSTFLKIISGGIRDYTGSIENIGGITIGYLEQIHFLDETKSIRDELKDAFTEIRNLEKIIQEEEKKLEETGEFETYTDALEKYKILWGYVYENEIERVSRGIGIFHLLERKLSEVSGGERTKVALAKTLLSKPEFLLLDEPTNFIDLASVEWLEKYLEDTWKWGFAIVSHDREFLDQTVTKVIEITGERGIDIYPGNYSDSVIEKSKKTNKQEKLFEEQQTLIESEKQLINRFRAGSRAGFAKSRERQLEKIEIIEKPIQKEEIKFIFEIPKERAPETLIKIEDAFIWRTDPLFYVREVEMNTWERIGIVGENGVGKSTFLKTILGMRDLEEEEIRWEQKWRLKVLEGYLSVAKNIEIGYYSQMHESLDTRKTIKENFVLSGLHYTPERIWGLLKSYGFDYHDGEKKVSGLSGGERSRLLFLFLNQKQYHLLILDEPTNHLDYDTREALEKSLRNYTGAILFISHDRYFVNKLANKIWIIEEGELVVSYGNYEDYRYKKEKWINFDMSLFDADGEMNLVLEEKLGAVEARRIKEKFSRKKAWRR